MKSRILKRPMFRMGGDVENIGIMDGMRRRYAEGPGPNKTETERQPMLFRPSMNDFLIQFGLDLASRPPGGNIFQTAAAAAKEPFAIMQAKKIREGELESERAFKKELLDIEMGGAKERAEIAAGIKSYDTYLDAGLKRFGNDIVMAENFAEFMSKTKKELDTTYGKSQFGGFIQQDLTKKGAREKFLDREGGKIGKVFYDLKQDKLFQIVKRGEVIGLQEVTVANIADSEGTTMPEPSEGKTKLTSYQEKILEGVDKSVKEKEEEKEKQRIKNLQEQPEFPEYNIN